MIDAHDEDSIGEEDDGWIDLDLKIFPQIQTSSENAGGVTATAGFRFRF